MAPSRAVYAAASLALLYLTVRDYASPASTASSASSSAPAFFGSSAPQPAAAAAAAAAAAPATTGVTFSLLDDRGEVARVVAPPRARHVHVSFCSS
jgi:hypothetical protein